MIGYMSTRDFEQTEKTYSEVLLEGLAPDGGLYVPNAYPNISHNELRQLSRKPYVEVFAHINSKFIAGDIPLATQREMAAAAFSTDKFPDATDGNITPVTWLTPTIAIQQLSLGPTAAFKDMAMQPLGQHMQYVLSLRDEKLTMLGATSGDTGSAAEAAMKDLDRVSLIMLSPEKGMSPFQKAQMADLSGGNILNISVDGRFDDCQDMVKELKKIPEFADLGAVNSINWGRVAAQVAYYVHGYNEAVQDDVGKFVDFVVPTGNFGNILAGYIAREMGLPIRNLIVATNENNVIHQLIQTGVYAPTKTAFETSSPSMDITRASNFERLAYDIFGKDPQLLRNYMETLKRDGSVSFNQFGITNGILIDKGFKSGASTHSDRLHAIKWAASQGMLIDPHTADAVTVALKLSTTNSLEGVPLVCMSTAMPLKFEATMRESLGYTPKRPKRFQDFEARVEHKRNGFTLLKAGDLDGLSKQVRAFRA